MAETNKNRLPDWEENSRRQALLHSALSLLREQSRLLEKRAALQKEFFSFLGKPEPRQTEGGESYTFPQKSGNLFFEEKYADCLARLARLHERIFQDIELADPRCLLIFEVAETMETLRGFLPRMEEKGGKDG